MTLPENQTFAAEPQAFGQNDPIVVPAPRARTIGEVLAQMQAAFAREGRPEQFAVAVSSMTPDELAELASWHPDSTERVARTYLTSLLQDEFASIASKRMH